MQTVSSVSEVIVYVTKHILQIDDLKLRCHATNYFLAINILMLLPNFLIKAGNLLSFFLDNYSSRD